MTGKASDQEPSIEEILASIRQIISDDEPREQVEVELPKEEKFEIPVHQPEPEKPEPPRQSFADVLELTNEIREEEEQAAPPEEPKSPEPVPEAAPEPEPEPEPEKAFEIDFQEQVEEEEKPVPADFPVEDDSEEAGSIFTGQAANATADAFSRLVGNMPIDRQDGKSTAADGRVTLEDVVRDLLRPMLRQWIDDNVPRLVERLVEKELEKLARKALED